MDILGNMLVLKPYFKKFLLLRKHKHPYSGFKVSRNRKNLTCKVDSTENCFKFDYISSLLDNPYEEVNVVNENELLNSEAACIVNNYIHKINEKGADGRDLLVLYISKELRSSDNTTLSFNTNIMHILNDVYKHLDSPEYQITAKLMTNDCFYDLPPVTESNFIEELEKSMILAKGDDAKNIIGLYFVLSNIKQSHNQVKLLYMSVNDCVRLPQILMKFNEINSTKKKKLQSSKKKKSSKDIGYILDETGFISTYYFATFIDIELDDINMESLKELLYSIN
jgi:hypothetical protein